MGACLILITLEESQTEKRLTKAFDFVKTGSYYSAPNNGKIISRERVGKKGKYELITYEHLKENTIYDLRISFWKQIANFDPVNNPQHRLDRMDEDLLEKEIVRLREHIKKIDREIIRLDNKIQRSTSKQQAETDRIMQEQMQEEKMGNAQALAIINAPANTSVEKFFTPQPVLSRD